MEIITTEITKTFTRTVRDNDHKKGGKQKKEEFNAVDHINMKAEKGEILGVLGPNGAGKTTLLRMLGTLMQPTEGSVSITDENGRVITNPVELKKNIGYLSENTKLYHRLTTRELLHTIADIYGIEADEQKKRIEEISNVLGMEGFIDNRIELLSTGQTQRASIARCLIHHPSIYIFDEPTLGLDIISSDAIIKFMKNEKKDEKTVIYSTHYMEEAQYLCDRIIMLYHGKVIAQGTPQELITSTNTLTLRETFHALVDGMGKGDADEQ
ncbi:MAG TPA: ABC transporter ATP-binding protein [Lachnospiraceae bacterium]|nr:ABC transporter ATP-binding protein [Lachnospiraceae bacterium]